MKHLFLFLVLVSSISAFAVQYQAKDATLGGDAVISGDYVQMKGGDLTFNSVNVSTAGMYDIRINYKQDYDEIKKQKLVVNGAEVGEVAFPKITEWTNIVAVARLNSGSNKIAIINSWGWVDIKYIDVVPHEAASFNLDPLVNPNAPRKRCMLFCRKISKRKLSAEL